MFKIGITEIDIIQGDITEATVDAIVNAANNQLYMGSGVAGAIKRKGGQQIEDEAVQKGPVQVGMSVLTSAGNLKSKYVIHATVMGIDLITDAGKIRNATLSALDIADKHDAKSIAFPALGTGVGGFPLVEAARIMFKAIKEYFVNPGSSIEKVTFVLFGYEAYNVFLNRALKDLKD